MLRQLISKWGIMSTEMQEAYTKDMAEIKEDNSYEYVDNGDDIEIVENQNIEEIETTDNVNQNQYIKTRWNPSEELKGAPEQGSIL